MNKYNNGYLPKIEFWKGKLNLAIEAGVKYVMVYNRPRFGTVEAILNEVINEGREFAEVVRFYTDSTGRPAAAKAKVMLNIK